MPLSIFVDALPYTYLQQQSRLWATNAQVAALKPNIGYSSVLHWQLYCNRYPDQRGTFVDWTAVKETRRSVCLLSECLRPLDCIPAIGWLSRKALDRVFYRGNVFANIPYRFRPMFSNQSSYLFFDGKQLQQESVFLGYAAVLQDEGHRSFEDCMTEFLTLLQQGTKNIFLSFVFADQIGHTCRRGEHYDDRLRHPMQQLFNGIAQYHSRFPQEEILLISDHGMSTVQQRVSVDLHRYFGKETKKTYFSYRDTAVMCVFTPKQELYAPIAQYLQGLDCGHLLTEDERVRYGVTDHTFGDLIFILHEGFVFDQNWFGRGIKKQSSDGSSSHGFWHGDTICDQTASVLLISPHRTLLAQYEYETAYQLIQDVMQG